MSLQRNDYTQYIDLSRQVRFWFKATATGLRRDVTLSALDFISLIVKHIPPKGMQLMRHAGLYARNTKAKLVLSVAEV